MRAVAGREPIGTLARRTARSKARAKSRWLVNRSRPRLAYLIRSFCTIGSWGLGASGFGLPSNVLTG